MRFNAKVIASILLLISAILLAYDQVLNGFSFLQSTGIVLMLAAIVFMIMRK
jgi:uncharacterized membrane protein